MAEDAANTDFHSIAEAATASWYARRTSTPNSKQPPSIHKEFAHQEIDSLRPDDAAAKESARGQIPAPIAASATPASPAPPPSIHTSVAAAMNSSASTTPISSVRGSEAQAQGDASMRSEMTAWKSALQSLPFEFANAPEPLHPLAQALADQPTLRSIEWNQYRLAGSFVPRTPHDYSSLMIYLCGQVNPNPCRNCLLRNGPFARCVVSPPAVLANSTLRHACANCTYQNQYKKCTNEPISEQEKARSDIVRSMMRTKNPMPRPPMPRKPKINSQAKSLQGSRLELEDRLGHRRRWKRDLQLRRQLEEGADVSMTQSTASLGIGPDLKSFDEKLRHIRARSPRSRRRIAAEMLQWQAAIATVEAEEPGPVTEISISSSATNATPNHHLPAPPSCYTPSQPILTSSIPTGARASVVDSFARTRTTSYGAEHTYEAMGEDESQDEQEDDYEATPWVGPDHTGSFIKAPL
ncbi:hypothetical protein F5Y12DRAFT_731261 [Xylaria sp. FL1777]|nr:hypothetical protein F5Y12DRAFT_731261 [Xylaria sp. FL1777]